MAWAQKAGDAVLDLGAPIQATARISAEGVGANDSQASGYSLLQGARGMRSTRCSRTTRT